MVDKEDSPRKSASGGTTLKPKMSSNFFKKDLLHKAKNSSSQDEIEGKGITKQGTLTKQARMPSTNIDQIEVVDAIKEETEQSSSLDSSSSGISIGPG